MNVSKCKQGNATKMANRISKHGENLPATFSNQISVIATAQMVRFEFGEIITKLRKGREPDMSTAYHVAIVTSRKDAEALASLILEQLAKTESKPVKPAAKRPRRTKGNGKSKPALA